MLLLITKAGCGSKRLRKFNKDREDNILKVQEELSSIIIMETLLLIETHCAITKEMVFNAMEKYGVSSKGLSDRISCRPV